MYVCTVMLNHIIFQMHEDYVESLESAWTRTITYLYWNWENDQSVSSVRSQEKTQIKRVPISSFTMYEMTTNM